MVFLTKARLLLGALCMAYGLTLAQEHTATSIPLVLGDSEESTVKINDELIKFFGTIRFLLEDTEGLDINAIPLPNVTSKEVYDHIITLFAPIAKDYPTAYKPENTNEIMQAQTTLEDRLYNQLSAYRNTSEGALLYCP